MKYWLRKLSSLGLAEGGPEHRDSSTQQSLKQFNKNQDKIKFYAKIMQQLLCISSLHHIARIYEE